MKATTSPRRKRTIFEVLDDPRATAALPSLKAVLDELQHLTGNSNVRIDEVTRLVRADQGMSLRVLRVANSAYYAPTEPLMDVQAAVLYIGFGTFRESVISARCIEKTCTIEQNIFDWHDFWLHAAGVGLIAQELATHLTLLELTDESFYLLGLLHDIGKVVLAQLLPEEFDFIYKECQLQGKSPGDLEMMHLGIDHGHLGSWYLEKQGIPPSISEPVRFHHAWQLTAPQGHSHACLISLADKIALWAQLGQSGNHETIVDPFTLPEWKAYVGFCGAAEDEGAKLKADILSKTDNIKDLARKLIS